MGVASFELASCLFACLVWFCDCTHQFMIMLVCHHESFLVVFLLRQPFPHTSRANELNSTRRRSRSRNRNNRGHRTTKGTCTGPSKEATEREIATQSGGQRGRWRRGGRGRRRTSNSCERAERIRLCSPKLRTHAKHGCHVSKKEQSVRHISNQNTNKVENTLRATEGSWQPHMPRSTSQEGQIGT